MLNKFTKSGLNYIEYAGEPVAEWIFRDPIELVYAFHHAAPGTERVFRAIMAASADHGLTPPSTIATRLAASCGNTLNQSIAVALITLGDIHGPIESAARMLKRKLPPGELRQAYGRVPGFGHPVHKVDPRVNPLLDLASIDLPSQHFTCLFAEYIAEMPVTPNLAGVTAALMLDMGFHASVCSLPFILGRIIGLSGHYYEQLWQEKLLTYEKLNPKEGGG